MRAPQTTDWSETTRRLGLCLGFVVAYVASVIFSLTLTKGTAGVASIWTANGVLAAAFILLPRRWSLGLAAVLLPFNFAIGLYLGNALLPGLVFPLLNLAEALAAVWLARKVCGHTLRLTSISRVVKLIAFAIAPSTAATAVVAADVLSILDRPFNEVLSTWFYSHTLGMGLILPSLLLLLRSDMIEDFRRRPLEQFGLYALVAAASLAVFLPVHFPMRLLLFPVLALVAFRLGPRGAAASALIVGALCSTLAMTGSTIPGLDAYTLVERAHNLQFLVAAAFLTSLATALAVADQIRMKRLWAKRTRVARAAEARATAADKAKAEFLATMSHEIRTPMNAIIGFTDVLLRRDDLPDPARRQLTLIDRAGASLLTVVNDILDFSKLEAGEVKFTLEPTTTRAVAQDALAIVAESARRKGLDLQLAFVGPVETPVLLDGLRLRQVLLNLLSNAIKFTDVGRVRLDVLAAETEGGLKLKFNISDTGVGIPASKVDQLFKRFSQVDSSVRRAQTGTGLGLAICKGLTEGMGGAIGVDSAEGIGSAFWIEIPAELANRPAAPAAARAPVRTEALAARILLVDDHPMNLELGATVLTLLGCDVVRAEDGEQAVIAARDSGCDLILMDVHMPRMDGLEATRRIRALSGPVARIPIIGMSADVMPEMEAACLKAGMNQTVGKPIQIEPLHDVLAKWLGETAAVRAA